MGINQEFLQKLSILYVEDDERIRESFTSIFSKLFKNVTVAIDGEDGLEKYKELREEKQFDIIISDINMPNVNGMEMLKEIRNIDQGIPFIFTTAHADSEYLLEAIRLGVTHYLIKPIDIKQMMIQVQDICSKNDALDKLYKTQKSNETYLDIINKVAIVSKTDLNGDITYVNDIFCDVSGYTRDELIGSNQRIVRHPDVPAKVFESLWEDLVEGKSWRGKIKNRAKDGTAYYVDANIFPLYEEGESISGWMAVRFLITDAEEEKQKFYKNVVTNIKTYKQTQTELQNKVVELESKQQVSENIDLIQERMLSEKEKSEKAKQQLMATENELCELKEKLKEVVSTSNEKIKKLASKITEDKATLEKQNKAVIVLKEQNDKNLAIINNSNTELNRLTKRVRELEDVVKHGMKK